MTEAFTEDVAKSCRLMIDALREVLGKEPLYSLENINKSDHKPLSPEQKEYNRIRRVIRYQRDKRLLAKKMGKKPRIDWSTIDLPSLLAKDLTIAQICQLLNCGENTLYFRMRKLGLNRGIRKPCMTSLPTEEIS